MYVFPLKFYWQVKVATYLASALARYVLKIILKKYLKVEGKQILSAAAHSPSSPGSPLTTPPQRVDGKWSVAGDKEE